MLYERSEQNKMGSCFVSREFFQLAENKVTVVIFVYQTYISCETLLTGVTGWGPGSKALRGREVNVMRDERGREAVSQDGGYQEE